MSATTNRIDSCRMGILLKRAKSILPGSWSSAIDRLIQHIGPIKSSTFVDPIESTEIGLTGLTPISEAIDENDIFLVAYPKSGSTWMQNLVAGLMYGIETRFLTDKLTQMIVPNVHGSKYFKRLGDVTCFKSHCLPRPDYRRVVYLLRDGRDAMVSYYHMINACSCESTSMEKVILDQRDSLFPCQWHEHVKAWMENPFDADLLLIKYEDLLQDPLRELRRFCDFSNIERSDEILLRSIEGNRFEVMQEKEAEFGWDNQDWNPERRFIRRGEMGSFRDEMPLDLIEEFERLAKSELVLNGYQLHCTNLTNNDPSAVVGHQKL